MAGHRLERTTEDIKRELTAIFRELKDPRVQQAFLSIIRVDVTNDLSYCTVYVSAMEGLDRANEAVRDLSPQQALFAVSFFTVLHSDMFHSLFLRLPTALSTVQTSAEF